MSSMSDLLLADETEERFYSAPLLSQLGIMDMGEMPKWIPSEEELRWKGKIAVDIDSTLYDFESVAREMFLKLALKEGNTKDKEKFYRKGHYVTWPEWRSPADVCGLETWLEVVDMCHQPEVILAQFPFRGAVKTLQELASSGFELMYISHRTGEAEEATEKWLQLEGFPKGEVICTDAEKKVHMRECQYLIDDRPKTIVEFVYDRDWPHDIVERWALSLSYPYNQALTDIPNVFLAPTWAGLKEWFVRKGKIVCP